MANKKISELDENYDLKDGCCFPVVSDNATKKIKFSTIKSKIDALLGITAHISSKSNPHNVTASQVGTYSGAEINALLLEKADALNVYDKETADSLFVGISEIDKISKEITRTNITANNDLNTLDMGEGTTASDFKLFVSTASSITKTLLNLPPNFPYNGFSLEYIRISGQQWLQRITGATYSSSGNVTSMTVYYRAGVGIQPTVTWGGWFMLSPTACTTTNTTEV